VGNDQKLQTVILQFIAGVGIIPAAVEDFARTGLRIDLDQKAFFVLGMVEDGIYGIPFEMEIVENISQFLPIQIIGRGH